MMDIALDPALFDLRNLAVALAVGFLIGFEREHTHALEARARNFAGARTFSLAAFAGGLCGVLDPGFVLPAVGAFAVAALAIAAYWAVARAEPGSGGTTEIALVVAFLLGVAAGRGDILIAAAGGVVVAVMLSVKETVRRWASALSEGELYAALRLLAISVLILPALPDRAFGPYDALNLREIWLLVVFISGLSFFGYWLIKLAGAGRGALVTGVVGGLASSTATTLSLARFAKDGADARNISAGIVAASAVMALRVCVLVAAISRPVLSEMLPALVAAAAAGAGAAIALSKKSGARAPEHALTLGNPMEIRPALFFAALLAVISVASSFGADRFGASGLTLVALVSGFADGDAPALVAARQGASGDVSAQAAALAVLAAAFANMVMKAGMAAYVGGAKTGMFVAGGLGAMIAAGSLALLIL